MNENSKKVEDNEKEQRIKQYEERKKRENEISNQALELMGRATELAKTKDYEEALNLYNEAVELLKEINWTDQIQTIQKTISQLEIEKIHYFQGLEKQKAREERQRKLDAEQAAALEEQVRKQKEMEEQRIAQYKEKKEKEEKASNQAYELMEKASELVNAHEFDKALEIYNESLELFKEINWTHEIQTTQKTISRVRIEKEQYFKGLEEKKTREERERRLKAEQEAKLEEEARKLREKEERERAQKLAALEDEKQFKQRITDMGEEADKMVREYEVEIKKGNFEIEPPYEQALGIYRNLHQMLLDRGWSEQARIASNQITHLKNKLEQDKYLREVEVEKIRKHQEYLDSLKFTKKEKDMSEYERKRKEEEDFQNQINDIMNEADRMHRDYEIEFRDRGIEVPCPYHDIIRKYLDLKEMLKERGWEGQVDIINKQLKFYKDMLEQDEKLRDVEEEKIRKHQEYLDSLKFTKKEKDMSEYEKKRKEEEDFQNQINNVMNEADRMHRDYEIEFRKRGIEVPCPYHDIIRKYLDLKDMLKERGWEGQVDIINKQLKFYKDKLDQDKKLREIEAQKIQKQKEYENHMRVKKD
ncbi:MAG: hypothetical protein ACFE8A_01865 [Candidatus Hodarchaeota archaeon]